MTKGPPARGDSPPSSAAALSLLHARYSHPNRMEMRMEGNGDAGEANHHDSGSQVSFAVHGRHRGENRSRREMRHAQSGLII